MSSSEDMTSHGSSGGIYTRLNHSGGSVKINPRMLAYTSTYGYSGDSFGEITNRKDSSYFDLTKAAHWSDGDNETMVKYGLSLLDDIEQVKAASPSQRDMIINELHAAGIKEIRGVPVEQRVVTSCGWWLPGIIKAAMAKNQDDIRW